MNTSLKRVLWIVALAAGVAIFVWVAIAGRNEAGAEAEREKPIKAPSRVSTQNGEVVVKMGTAEQRNNGIQVGSLKSAARKQELRATAVILPMQDLTALRNNYVSSKAQVNKAKAALDVSRRDYERLSSLYRDERNASAKSVQAAEGTMLTDQTSLQAAQDALFLTENGIRQQWGDVIARWLFSGSPAFDRLVRQQDLLIQATLPPGTKAAVPSSALLQTSEGKLLAARLVSPLPRLDPRLQAPSYLYTTPNRAGLIPGMNLVMLLPSGPLVQGIQMPTDAIVWWEGRAWTYVQVARDQFARREVPTNAPTNEGWFVAMNPQTQTAFKPGDKVVIRGGQQLLSEEFRAQVQVGQE